MPRRYIRITLFCELCNKEFPVSPSRSKTARFCSRKCSGIFRMQPLIDRYRRYVSKDEDGNGCILWTGAKRHGYGVINSGEGNKILLAHRLAYEIANGNFDKYLFVCHKCDVPACVNPQHLFLGTIQENLADMVAKNRHAKGEQKKKTHKLTEDQVLEMRCLHESGESQMLLAAVYRVDRSTVSDIVRKERWRHI
jgi:hypothetical protein